MQPVRKGIVLAGGSGTRLYPLTTVMSKQLVPIYDKPLIYYPLSTLMLAGIRDILIISTPRDLPYFQQLLGDGSRVGINLSYSQQPRPGGIAEAFLVGETFIGQEPVCLILGDNLFYGYLNFLRDAIGAFRGGATIFGYQVRDPEHYGVVTFDRSGQVESIEEKPRSPRSSFAVTGLYLYDEEVVAIARGLRPSARGELEITDVNRAYLERGRLNLRVLGRGIAWLDTGSAGSLLEASNFIEALETRQGLKIGCLEEVAIRMQYVSEPEALARMLQGMPHHDYRRYIEAVWQETRGEPVA